MLPYKHSRNKKQIIHKFISICTENRNVQSGCGLAHPTPGPSKAVIDTNGGSSDNYQIFNKRECFIRRFKLRGTEFDIKFNVPEEEINPIEWLSSTLKEIFELLTVAYNSLDFIGIKFNSDTFSKGGGWMSYRFVKDCKFEDFWNMFTTVVQSAGEFRIDDSFRITVQCAENINGKGWDEKAENIRKKKSILSITNKNDNLCLPRAIVSGIKYAERGSIRTGDLQKQWDKVRNDAGKFQRELATQLTQTAGVTIPPEGCGVDELKIFQKHLVDEGIKLVVFDEKEFGSGEKLALFDGMRYFVDKGTLPRYTVNLMFYREYSHYQTILSLTGAAMSRNFCVPCNKSYRRKQEHRCSNKCSSCYAQPACLGMYEQNQSRKCNTCLRNFFGDECYARHLKPNSYSSGKTICDVLRICDSCSRLVDYSRMKSHDCLLSFCNTCKTNCEINHQCFMRLDKERAVKQANQKGDLFIFYDFETRQNETVAGTDSVNIHKPILCVAQQVCTFCLHIEDKSYICEQCGIREYVFDKKDPVRDFVNFALSPVVNFRKKICIAHNSKGYDAQFILNHIVNSVNGKDPELILSGTKIISMRVDNTSFIDSLNYFHLPLSALPAAFGLKGIGEKKGTFPHLFYTPEYKTYNDVLPDIKFYSPDTMNEKTRKEFISWYTEKKADSSYTFNYWEELVSYCKNDVDILRCACLAFRKIFLECGSVCPFTDSTTIASACNKFFRRHCLQENTIGIIPRGGYRWANNQSLIAIEWFLSLEREFGVNIIHAGRSREYRLLEGINVDGYFESHDKTIRRVYQFHGCYWHGCRKCFNINRDQKLNNSELTMDDRYSQTLALSEKIRGYGYELVEMWECEFNRIKQRDAELRTFLQNQHILKKSKVLNPRDAFYGGRTGNTKAFYEVKGDERIEYKDVCSLYPFINKTGKYPVGHPKLYIGKEECQSLTGTDNDLTNVEGLVLCKVLPPRDLYHPLLPVRQHGKLMFPLCRSCCDTLEQGECTHEEESQRVFEGTWVSDELKEAVHLGYRIVEIYEIWQYSVTQYNPNTRDGGLFVTYINKFLKIKQEADGWPVNCTDEASKSEYIQSYERAEGIRLDSNNIAKNPGLRSVAKLCLNSFWGKFGQRDNLPQTTIVRERSKLLEMLTNPDIQVNDIIPVNETTLYLCWQYRQEAFTTSKNTNVVIAAYTTAQARLKLYGYLSKLGRRVLYYDTDSCIYVSHNTPDEYKLPVGSFLGDMTDELEKDYGIGSFIKTFVSGGPKFYSYKVKASDGSEPSVCKAKGITLNFKNSRLINFDSIRELVTSNSSPVIVQSRVIRTNKLHEVVTRDEEKKCRVVNMKRRRAENYDSLPYGYKKLRVD